MNANRATTDALEIDLLPAAFSMDNLKELQLVVKFATAPGRKYLAHHVRRYPLDLRAQVQRILINQDQSELSGTLQDLFIALGGKGRVLRNLMLERVKHKLTEEHQQYFSEWSGSSVYDGRFLPGSVLSIGTPAKLVSLQLPSDEKAELSEYADNYQEAMDCIEYGQLKRAQELLEMELMDPGGDSRAEAELLQVYEYTKDTESREKMVKHLTTQGRTLSSGWDTPVS